MIAGLGVLTGSCGGSVCTGWSATYVSPDDKLTDATARKILRDNEYGAKLGCPGFKAKGKWF